MGSRIFAIATLVIVGGIIADVLIHPTGTRAAGDEVVKILKPSYNVVLGKAS